jgi:hypothetical protein
VHVRRCKIKSLTNLKTDRHSSGYCNWKSIALLHDQCSLQSRCPAIAIGFLVRVLLPANQTVIYQNLGRTHAIPEPWRADKSRTFRSTPLAPERFLCNQRVRIIGVRTECVRSPIVFFTTFVRGLCLNFNLQTIKTR